MTRQYSFLPENIIEAGFKMGAGRARRKQQLIAAAVIDLLFQFPQFAEDGKTGGNNS
jgi:hypothetical protein